MLSMSTAKKHRKHLTSFSINMSKSLISIFLGLCILCGSPIQAAQKAQNFPASLKTGEAKASILVLVYGEGWDKFGEIMVKNVWRHPSFGRAVGDNVLVEIPLRQNPTKQQEEQRNKLSEGLNSVPPSCPAIYFVDKDKRVYCMLSGADLAQNGEKVIALVKKKLELREQQRTIMDKAAKAQGVERARLIGEACALDIAWPNDAVKMVKEADPKDDSHIAARLEFSGWKISDEIKDMGGIGALKHVREIIYNPGLTVVQKQEALSIAVAKLRRENADFLELRKLWQEISDMDPTSMYGSAARESIKFWAAGLSFDGGWKPQFLSPALAESEIQGADTRMKKAGTYKLTFTYTGGSKGMEISKIRLYDGKTLIAEDLTSKTSNRANPNAEYILVAPQEIENPRLTCTFGLGPGEDSYGNISVKRQKRVEADESKTLP